MQKPIVIDAHSGVNIPDRLKECWQRWDLILMLSYRDIKVRYTQTAIGMLWALINPLISILLLFFVFNVIVNVDTDGIPPLLFTVSGLCAWNYFSKVVSEAGTSIVGAQALVKKIYFPRLVIPVSKAISGLIELFVVLVILFILLLYYRYPVDLKIFLLIPCIVLVFFIGLGCGIWVAALTIRFRDFHYIVPVLLRIGMFASPIAFGTKMVPEGYKWVVSLNPLTGIIDGFRYALFNIPLDYEVFMISMATSVVLLISGIIYFLRMEKYIADIV
ncbi:MAG TPA: ABC transporter permease [Saprospiraceae bacterium]|nr:ABC transporter permease [Saprospiraceae bacterium]